MFLDPYEKSKKIETHLFERHRTFAEHWLILIYKADKIMKFTSEKLLKSPKRFKVEETRNRDSVERSYKIISHI